MPSAAKNCLRFIKSSCHENKFLVQCATFIVLSAYPSERLHVAPAEAMNVRLRKSIKCADMQSSLICVVAGVPADEKFDRPDSGWVSDWLNIIRIF